MVSVAIHSDLEPYDAPNSALIGTLTNMFEAPLDCSTMNSSNPSLPPFLALPLVPMEDMEDEKDLWVELDLASTMNLEELQSNLTNVNLLNDIEECSTIYEETETFGVSTIEECSTMCEETILFTNSNVDEDTSSNDLTEPFEKGDSSRSFEPSKVTCNHCDKELPDEYDLKSHTESTNCCKFEQNEAFPMIPFKRPRYTHQF